MANTQTTIPWGSLVNHTGVGGVGARFEQISRCTPISICRMVRLKLLTVLSFSFCRMDSGSGVRSSGKVEGGSEESTG